MDKYPNKKSSINKVLFGIRIDAELKARISNLRKSTDKDVSESIRVKMRELCDELEKNPPAA